MPANRYQRASKAVQAAVTSGRLLPVSRRRCQDCGAKAQHYHHHLGYEPEHLEDVVPLCRACHHARHGRTTWEWSAVSPGRRRNPTAKIAARFPESLHDRLAAIAAAQGRSLNETMLAALQRYLRAWEGRQGSLKEQEER